MTNVRADAPGRVNLIGEHTDYQDGYVLPIATPQRTCVEMHRRADSSVRVWSDRFASEPFSYTLGEERRSGSWADYVQGVTWAVARAERAIAGFDLTVRSNVPVGAGLSSSAALEVATLRGLRAAFDLSLDDVELARTAQRAEVEFVGAPVGIMDQMASSLAAEREALFLDTRTLGFERIPLPEALGLIVIDSGVAHRHASGEYAIRRRESEDAARQLGVGTLRDVPVTQLDRLRALPPTLMQRARHVITENDRVLQARSALLQRDLRALGRLLSASHASLRDDYEVSVAEVDLLVDIAVRQRSVFGARMTGGGFGGAVVVAAEEASSTDVACRIRDEYAQRAGRSASILVPLDRPCR